jgi:hypothetical protein
MSTTEIRNLTSRCLDRESIDEIVLHEVNFEIKESGGDWHPHRIEVMAKDPMDAINHVRLEEKNGRL